MEMSPDTNSPGHTQWFYFTVSGVDKGKTLNFRIINFKKNKSLFAKGMKICVHSKKKFRKRDIGWKRGGRAFEYKSNDGYLSTLGLDEKTVKRNQKKYSLEFSHRFEYDNDEVSFAFCFPYTYEDLLFDTHTWMNKMKKIKHM